MVLHPEVQRRAQAEIDSVVGTDRLPSFEDRSQLPYVEAVVKEVFRWNPVAPLGMCLWFKHRRRFELIPPHSIGVPHKAIEDDVHNGYHIPKGSIVIANIWYESPRDYDSSVSQLIL